MIKPLSPEELRNSYDSTLVECKSTAELEPLDGIIGQDRALKALTFGLNIKESGFNIYVSGVHGTGRKAAVEKFLHEISKARPEGNDWIYVNNFQNPYEPNAIRLPPGMGIECKDDMAAFIAEAKRVIPKIFESEDYVNRRDAALQSLENEKAKLFAQIDASAREKNFVIQPGPQGLLTIPLKEGTPMEQETFLALPEEEQREYQKRREELTVEMRNTFRQLRELDQKGMETVEQLNRDVALGAMGHRVASLKDKYAHVAEVNAFIDAVQVDMVENLPQFMEEVHPPQQPAQMPSPLLKELTFRKYEVNVIVDNSGSKGAPIVFEQNPTYSNLFGRVEREFQYGVVTTDFTMIRSGSIHKANGGFLVLPIEDLFRNPFVWDGLKSTLKTEKIAIEEPAERMGYITTKSIKPESIPLDLKVILIGTPIVNQILYTQDPDFSELFKVKADFDSAMDRNQDNVRKYAAFVCTICEKYHLKHLDRSAMAKIIEYGSRLADDTMKLTTRFSLISDVLREASYYATLEDEGMVEAKHIMKAIDERTYRSSLVQEKIQEYITRGIFLIDTTGEKVGQVNGLSVMSLGDIEFGRPSRVTASIGIGKEGIMDIEREASMGGPSHTKGVLILSGYLAHKFAQDKPLSLNARLVFEQSYEGVDGDSASSTELYAILSALSEIPLKQNIAVTGSVNQRGEVQAIGGVNEKLEGFFEVCKAKGLSGNQGAMIPASNVQNLMLKEEIVEAAKAGKFTIYPVTTIDEGIEVLTGMNAGKRQPDGTFEKGTVNYLVDKRLHEMAEIYRKYQAQESR
ncbi:MAG TPA: ATP-binding protein [Methanoregulaceae archaeon]|nr:ATP-binding protein [Methanoregulaceae archaeon]